MSPTRRIVLLLAGLSFGAGCADEPMGVVPPPGTMLLRLATPHGDDGALVFELTGPAIDSATAANNSLRLFTRRVSDSRLLGIVVGGIATGPVVTLHVSGAAAPGAPYTARIIEIADRDDRVRASLTGYALSVAR